MPGGGGAGRGQVGGGPSAPARCEISFYLPFLGSRPRGIRIQWESVWENPWGGVLGRSWRKMVNIKSAHAPGL